MDPQVSCGAHMNMHQDDVGPYVDTEGRERTFSVRFAFRIGLAPGASPFTCSTVEAAWLRGRNGRKPQDYTGLPYLELAWQAGVGGEA